MTKANKIILLIAIILILGIGIFWIIKNNSNNSDNSNNKENNTKTNFFTLGYDGGLYPGIDDYKYLDSRFYYKKLYSYEEYVEYKEKFPQILLATEEDFKENFMIIILIENQGLDGLIFNNYYTISDTLQIELAKDKNINSEKTNGNAILISKDSDREKVNIEKIAKNMNMYPYKNIKELPSNYDKEQAIKDNCLLIDYNENKTYNKEKLEQFISDVKDKKNSTIRICRLIRTSLDIQDIEYVAEGKFNVNRQDVTSGEIYYEGDEIYTNEIEETILDDSRIAMKKIYTYTIKDENTTMKISIFE